MSELGVVLLDSDTLPLERLDHEVDYLGCGGHPDRREAQAVIDGYEGGAHLAGKAELVLDPTGQGHVALGKDTRHPGQEGTRTGDVGLTVQRHVIGEHRSGVGRVRQHDEGLGIGYEAVLADRTHALHGLELVERAHGLHGDGQADSGPHAVGQPVDMDGLPPHGPAVVAVEEADQPHAGLSTGVDDFVHGSTWRPPGVFGAHRASP